MASSLENRCLKTGFRALEMFSQDCAVFYAPPAFFLSFLSVAQPTDQGEESVVLVVVVGGDHFSVSHVQFFGV